MVTSWTKDATAAASKEEKKKRQQQENSYDRSPTVNISQLLSPTKSLSDHKWPKWPFGHWTIRNKYGQVDP